MATKKTETIAETPVVEKEKMITFTLEKNRYETLPMYVMVNGRSWLIPRGVEVTIPECAYLQVEHRRKMEAEALQYSESIKSKDF